MTKISDFVKRKSSTNVVGVDQKCSRKRTAFTRKRLNAFRVDDLVNPPASMDANYATIREADYRYKSFLFTDVCLKLIEPLLTAIESFQPVEAQKEVIYRQYLHLIKSCLYGIAAELLRSHHCAGASG